MSLRPDWLSKLKAPVKGIWSIECPAGMSFSVGTLSDFILPNCETKELTIVVTEDGAKVEESSRLGLSRESFKVAVERLSSEARENDKSFLRIVVDAFHNASIGEQCNLLKSARSIQESSDGRLPLQFVFCGRWSHYNLRPAYREIHGQTNSPPTDAKNAIQVPFWGDSEVFKLLSDRRLIGPRPTELDEVACGFLLEQTAGDEFLIRQSIERLEGLSAWTSEIERVLWELISAPDVIDEIRKRMQLLGAGATEELNKLLRVHNLMRDYEAVEAEELWLAGLVRRTAMPGGKQLVRMAGPIINSVVRNLLVGEASGCVAVPKDICFERESITVAAYRRIAKLENLLRNVVVSEWSIKFGDKWHEKLAAIRGSSRSGEDAEELIHRTLQNNYGISPLESGVPESKKGSNMKRKPPDLLASATDWQARQRENHAVVLQQDNLMHFLSTGDLISLLKNKKNGLCGDGRPFKLDHLTTALEDYTSIRSAVAHNQPIKLANIEKLDELNHKFQCWLSVFADKSNRVVIPPEISGS